MKFGTETAIKNLSKNGESLKQALEVQSKSLYYLINLISEDLAEEKMGKAMVLIKNETPSRDVIRKINK